ncbi:helix-turn-helix domain-containing protein [Desulfobacter latus]
MRFYNLISDYERGKRRLTPDMAKRIAESLNINVERLSQCESG